jgi:hypothetical protein
MCAYFIFKPFECDRHSPLLRYIVYTWVTLFSYCTAGNVMFVDISVPRNVHADCSTVAGALCYNVDHLKAVVQRNTNKRKREMLEAESILKEEQNKFRVSLFCRCCSGPGGAQC